MKSPNPDSHESEKPGNVEVHNRTIQAHGGAFESLEASFVDSLLFDREPYPYQSGRLKPDPHQSEKQDPDPQHYPVL